MLAHALPHSVIGLTLSPIDANSFFIILVGISDRLEKKALVDSFLKMELHPVYSF